MRDEVALLLVFLGLIAVVALSSFGFWAIRSRVAARRRHAWLRTCPIDGLVEQAREAIRFERWERFVEASDILSRAGWSERDLLHALEALWAAVVEEDRRLGRSGRDSNFFELYDSGIAAVLEALRDRVGLPQPWTA